VALVLAELAATQGRTGDADRYYRAAATFCQDKGLAPGSAITSVGWAELLTQRGDPADRQHAADLARHALRIAEQLGMDREAERAHSLLAPPPGAGPGGGKDGGNPP
jgi:cytochrome c-type biogenesis protein CcmH/NrfG